MIIHVPLLFSVTEIINVGYFTVIYDVLIIICILKFVVKSLVVKSGLVFQNITNVATDQ